jgi:hypothetical protein
MKMLKILMAVLVLLGLWGPMPGMAAVGEAAAYRRPVLVQVSDKKFEDFYELILMYNDAKETKLDFEAFNREPVKGEAYDTYLVGAKKHGVSGKSGAVIYLFANKAGPISKIGIMAMKDDKEGVQAALLSEYVILGALGLPDTVEKKFLHQFVSRGFPAQLAVWNSWSNRNLVVYHGLADVSDRAFYIRITAYDRRFPPVRRRVEKRRGRFSASRLTLNVSRRWRPSAGGRWFGREENPAARRVYVQKQMLQHLVSFGVRRET